MANCIPPVFRNSFFLIFQGFRGGLSQKEPASPPFSVVRLVVQTSSKVLIFNDKKIKQQIVLLFDNTIILWHNRTKNYNRLLLARFIDKKPEEG